MKRLRWARVLLLSLIVTLLFERTATAGANEGQYKLLALFSHEAAQFLELKGSLDGRIPCSDGVLNTSEGASLYYAFSETVIVCQRNNKASAHWLIYTHEGGIGLAAKEHSFGADSQNIVASDCVYVDVSGQSAGQDFGWECTAYMTLTQPFRVQFPQGSKLDESEEVNIRFNLSKLRNLVAPALYR